MAGSGVLGIEPQVWHWLNVGKVVGTPLLLAVHIHEDWLPPQQGIQEVSLQTGFPNWELGDVCYSGITQFLPVTYHVLGYVFVKSLVLGRIQGVGLC